MEDEVNITNFKQKCDMVVFLKAERNVIWCFLQLRLSDGKSPSWNAEWRIKIVVVL